MTQFGWRWDHSYSHLPQRLYKKVEPSPVSSPELVIFNQEVAKYLGLKVEALQSEEGIEILAGNRIPAGAMPIAQAYAGHQFGHFTLLGDGRAVLLGEQLTPGGSRFDIQLKGSGRTPFSRGGDGRATLGPMLREYLISEAMYALGIPTNRSLAVVTTGEKVIRETDLPGAIVTRVAASHLRIGTFEYISRWGTVEELRKLADYAIERHYPDIWEERNRYLSFLREVMRRQAKLIAQWQLVGFIHGVMNTDNMTISGETIDYGPCAFMDTYDPATVFSSIDVYGRYAYQNQPGIGLWNLSRFAEALLPLFHENQEQSQALAKEELAQFGDWYQEAWLAGMGRKLGLSFVEEEDEALVEEMLRMMEKYQADFTHTFRALTQDQLQELAMHGSDDFVGWYEQWQNRLKRQKVSMNETYEIMRQANPAIIPRNHRVEEALERAVDKGDYTLVRKLNEALSQPYAYTPEQDAYAALPDGTDIPYRTFCGT